MDSKSRDEGAEREDQVPAGGDGIEKSPDGVTDSAEVPESSEEKASQSVGEKASQPEGAEEAHDGEDDEKSWLDLLRVDFPEIDRFIVHSKSEKGVVVLSALLKQKSNPKYPWAQQIISFGLSQDLIIYPLVFTHQQSRVLGESLDQFQWTPAGHSDGEQLVTLDRARLKAKSQRQYRRLLLKEIRSAAEVVKSLRAVSVATFPVRLKGAVSVFRYILELLYATRGQVFEPHSLDSIRVFNEEFGSDFAEFDVSIFYEAEARCEQVRLCQQLGPRRGLRKSVIPILDRMLGFLAKFRAHVYQQFATKPYRIARISLKIAGWATGIILFSIGLIQVMADYGPYYPIRDPSVITRPGGITVNFYKGPDLNRFGFKTDFKTVNFRRNRSIRQGFPANNYSMETHGYVQIPRTGFQYICTRHDDGVKFHFGGRLIVDDYEVGRARNVCQKIWAVRGWHKIKVQYFNGPGSSELRLKLGRFEEKTKIIPANLLCCQMSPEEQRKAVQQRQSEQAKKRQAELVKQFEKRQKQATENAKKAAEKAKQTDKESMTGSTKPGSSLTP